MTIKELGHDRVILLQTCSKANLSQATQEKIFLVIKNCRLNQGSEKSDVLAKKITDIINITHDEAKILQMINDIHFDD